MFPLKAGGPRSKTEKVEEAGSFLLQENRVIHHLQTSRGSALLKEHPDVL